MKTTPTPPSLCLCCGEAFELATNSTGDERGPVGGNVAMCLICGTMHIFKDDLTIRAPTRDEMRTMARDPAVWRAAAIHAAWRAKRQRH